MLRTGWERLRGGERTLRLTFHYRDINWLFQKPDISPFSRDFRDDSAEPGIEYIANELYANSSLMQVEATVLLPPDQITPDLEQRTLAAIRRYCSASHRAMKQEELAQRWRMLRSALLAIVMLVVLVAVAEPLEESSSLWLKLVGQGLMFLGWVTLWFPLDTFVFGIRHSRLDADIYLRAMEMKLEIRADQVQ